MLRDTAFNIFHFARCSIESILHTIYCCRQLLANIRQDLCEFRARPNNL